jgi:Cof subfamily protein (haloacid dehalogenase superfamily)
MIATARPLRNTILYYEAIPFDAMTVSNGARIIYGNQKTEYGIPLQSANKLLDALGRYSNLRITLETGDHAYSNKPIQDYETTLSNDLKNIAQKEGVLKILVHIDDDKTLSIVEKCLTKDLYYTIANGHLIQIMNKSATKWNGVKVMLDAANCTAEETIYFGDDYDDIESIKMCGIGVAVSNATAEVKSEANYITESNDEDGVAKFIEKRILKNPS